MERYDDMIDTVIDRAEASPSLQAVGWQQLVDLLARGPSPDAEHAERAFAALDRWRPTVSAQRRARTCAAVADTRMPDRLFEHLALDETTVAAPVLTSARVTDEALIALLSRLSGPARAMLRHRGSLSPELERSLDAFGPGDRALTVSPDAAVAAARIGDEGQAPDRPEETRAPPLADRPLPIRDLVERIDRFRLARPATTRSAQARSGASPAAAITRFAFETGRNGAIRWTDAPLRGAVVGLSLAEALGSELGVDVATADRFARRAPIRSAQLRLAPGTALGTEWRMDATPVFDSRDGRFTGYVGHARSGAAADEPSPERSDIVRQLVHELKTPLNAILGFSELIEQQLLGPVPGPYQAHARTIRRTGHAVLAAIEDVDLSAHIDARDRPDSPPAESDLTATVAGAVERANEASVDGPVFVARPGNPRIVRVDPVETIRMVERLLDSIASLCAPGERLAVAVSGRKRGKLRVRLPQALAGVSEEELARLRFPVDVGEAEAPLLGLEFTLRLVRRLAEEAGGALAVTREGFTLSLPVAMHGEAEQQL